ncbi:MAG: energy transducer TonB [Pyrinomonadaceae bacterium]
MKPQVNAAAPGVLICGFQFTNLNPVLVSKLLLRLLPLTLAFAVGYLSVHFYSLIPFLSEAKFKKEIFERPRGSGISGSSDRWSLKGIENESEVPVNFNSSPLRIISKPRPIYTEDARQNNVQGTVILRLVFLASGNIGAIEPIKTLPNGLTEQAVEAAKKIRFEPNRVNGRPVSVRRMVEYTFTIY